MKKFYLLLILIATNHFVNAQRSSLIYNEKGQLFVDSSLSISKLQYKTWTYAEYNLLAIFSTIEYPPIYLENGIKPKNIIIASFFCDSTDIREIKVLNDSSAFSFAVISGLEKSGKRINDLLKGNAKNTTEKIYLGKYYIAFDFMLIDFYEQLKKQKAIPIIKSSIPMVIYKMD